MVQNLKRNRNKPQTVSVLINHQTNQFFVTFNNIDADMKGRHRIVSNYLWVVKRITEIKAGIVKVKPGDPILHSLQYGMMWALHNSNVNDWQEQNLKGTYKPKDITRVEKRIASKLERLGYVNVRTHFAKVVATNVSNSQRPTSWGQWNPVTSYDRFSRKLDSLEQAMNKKLTLKYKTECYYAANGSKATVKNAEDLWEKFERDGVFK
jgi:hypothetical protein